jgi:SLT domain-containing protein
MSYCNSLGFVIDHIFNETLPYTKELTNGSVIEIIEYCQNEKVQVLKIPEILSQLTKTSNVAYKACVAKIYRNLKTDKEKRGEKRKSFGSKRFPFPVKHL